MLLLIHALKPQTIRIGNKLNELSTTNCCIFVKKNLFGVAGDWKFSAQSNRYSLVQFGWFVLGLVRLDMSHTRRIKQALTPSWNTAREYLPWLECHLDSANTRIYRFACMKYSSDTGRGNELRCIPTLKYHPLAFYVISSGTASFRVWLVVF